MMDAGVAELLNYMLIPWLCLELELLLSCWTLDAEVDELLNDVLIPLLCLEHYSVQFLMRSWLNDMGIP